MEQPDVDSMVQEELETDEGTSSDETEFESADNTEAEDGQSAESEDDAEDVEFEGKQYKLPKELKEALLRQSDYTRKTQEVAEQRKAVEAEKQSLEQRHTFEAQNLEIVADIRSFDRELSQLSQVNLMQLADQDPVQAQRIQIRMQQLQAIRGQATSALAQRQQQFEQWQQQETARRLADGERVLQREIPGWGAELKAKLVDFVKGRGYSREYLATHSADPHWVMDQYHAYSIAEAKKKVATKTKPVQEKPVTRISANKAKGAIDPDKMSPEQWLKWRNSQIKKR